MRIDAYNQISQVYGVQKNLKTQKSRTGNWGLDQVSISQVAKNAVSEASDIREDKVAQLKEMVDSGAYVVEPGDFASKLLEKYNQTL